MSGLPGQAYLEQLRPDTGWSTRYALLTSYSADPIVLGGVLLALSGRARESGSGGRADFAESVEMLRDRLRVIVQRGRLQRLPNLPRIAAVLDQFIIEQPYDERRGSWHPKLALVCYEGPADEHSWRLWIGSRNLTRSRDLDIGLLLDGSTRRRKGARRIEGITALAQTLAGHARAPVISAVQIAAELANVYWSAPDEVSVAAVELADRGIAFEAPFEGELDRILLFSPFLCAGFARTIEQWRKETDRCTLVTTLSAVRALDARAKAALRDVQLLALAPPHTEGAIAAAAGQTESDDSEPPPTSLHAKLYVGWRGERAAMVVGSANATSRAWSDRNAEAIARFDSGTSIVAGVESLAGAAIPISADILEEPPSGVEETEAQLDAVRKALAADWTVAIDRAGERFTLWAKHPPELKPSAMRLDVGLATCDLVHWTPGETRLDLGLVPLSLQTDLVQFRLMLGEQGCEWMQRIPATPAIDGARDHAAIGRFLGPSGFHAWMRALLEGDSVVSDDRDWDQPDRGAGTERPAGSDLQTLSLEEMLTAWARDPAAFKRVDARFDTNLTAVLSHADALSQREVGQLEQLRDIWSTARSVLLGQR